jgi:hypothetical protein
MGDYSWVIERFQVGRFQIFELSMGKTVYGIAQSIFQWISGRQKHSWVSTVSDLSFEG